LVGSYNTVFVALSLAVAILASYTALDLASRITASRGAAAASWLLGGAFAMGTGIWSMHFVGMLAFRLPIPMSYDVGITLASMLIAVVVSAFALLTVSRGTLGLRGLAVGGVLMGIGISSMHYAGMAAMDVQPAIRYDPMLFAASIAIAIAASTAALWIAFTLRAGVQRMHARLGSAIIMGLAIVGMHYTGMAAARFAPDAFCTGGSFAENSWMAATVAGVTFLILCGTLALSLLDARNQSRTAQMASSLHEANAQLQHLALHDTLTRLPNRLLLEDRAQQVIEECRRSGDQCAVLLVGLDRFKTLNDSLGHFAGDTVLRTVAARLRSAVRAEDTVARLGGDEFVVLLRRVAAAGDAERLARALIGRLSQPIQLDGQDLRIGSSVGVGIFPQHGDSPSRLIANADGALAQVKRTGGSGVAVFDPSMADILPRRLALENELRRALERGQFILHYQPKVDVRTGVIVGMEALARWNHPERGLVAPAEFVSFAEETGLIVPFGDWVVREACMQNRAWQRRGLPPMPVAVNISAAQFRQRDFVQGVAEALAETGLAARYLELELTETVVMHEPEEAASMLRELHAMGVSLSIDDFGTGYSSLAYLKRFPIRKLKIDQSFVRDIPADADDVAIVRAIVAMAHGLRLRVVAEGVEREDQLELLRTLGADEYQGYLYSRPLAAHEIERRLGRFVAA